MKYHACRNMMLNQFRKADSTSFQFTTAINKFQNNRNIYQRIFVHRNSESNYHKAFYYRKITWYFSVKEPTYLACFSFSSSYKDCNFHVSSKKLIHALTVFASTLQEAIDLDSSSSQSKDMVENNEDVKAMLHIKHFLNLQTNKEKVTKPLLSNVAQSDCWLHQIGLSPLQFF